MAMATHCLHFPDSYVYNTANSSSTISLAPLKVNQLCKKSKQANINQNKGKASQLNMKNKKHDIINHNKELQSK